MHVTLLHHILNNTTKGKTTAWEILEEMIDHKNEEDFVRTWRALACLRHITPELVYKVKEKSLETRFDSGLAWSCSKSIDNHGVCYMSPRVMVYVDGNDNIGKVKHVEDREASVVVYHKMLC